MIIYLIILFDCFRFFFSEVTRHIVGQHLRVFFRGVSGGIVVLLSSLASFVASTRLIQSRIGAIDSPDQSRQGFEQYNTSEVLEKISRATFRSLVVKKC